MKSAEIREAFLKFFQSKGHTAVPSSSLVPHDDPTLLFTNAGMNQFKDCFLGLEQRGYTRATSSQKCVRAGGKHNDLENVGYTARHHTFFEMLGNFSFGDYFKQDAIHYAWEFLTGVAKLPKEKLWITVYATDDEAYDIWHQQIGVPAERIIRIGDNKGAPYASDNFWAMGDTGPCGPCTEIFYDHGEHIWGGPPGSPEEDGDRYIEIWNVVFMQFNRTADGQLHPLPAPSVDTGMGLERIAAVLQGVHANYEIDLFQNLLKASAEAIGCENSDAPSLKVVADHIRSCSFLVADGVIPSNEGRGYVLRRIIRRACRHGHKLGAEGSFFYRIVAALAQEMGDAYPQLREQQAHIEKVLKQEEEQFAKTLDQGMKILEQDLANLQGSVIPGSVAFKLYDTFGFPLDLTADIARERQLTIDEAGFEQEMEAQRDRARAASHFGMDYNSLIKVDRATEFTGYETAEGSARVVGLYRDGQPVETLQEGEQGVVLLDSTPFYAESGGQVGDSGQLLATGLRFDVQDTTKAGEAHLHQGVLAEGTLSKGQQLTARVNNSVRTRTRANHSATHLLHAALRQVLGTGVQQKGSLVDSERLRFDFSHGEAVSPVQLQEITRLVNEQIRANAAVTTELLDLETARARGAMALFGEKYADEVRVLSMGTQQDQQPFSIELCGGLHVNRTGDIALFHITSESGIASGVRRIEGVTGEAALNYLLGREQQLLQAASQLKVKPEQLLERLENNQERTRQLEKEIQQLKKKLASGTGTDLTAQTEQVGDIKVLASLIDGADVKTLRDLMDQLKQKLAPAAVVLAAVEGDKVSLIAGISGEAKDRLHAGKLVNHVALQIGGKGGGRPDMAQAGGTDAAALPAALASVKAWVAEQLGQA
ncbi:alanine--tRNA ligase [Marinospirillum alkaliphilum]|uniref:Alanine--tRNA ligase n=1 Tax=Marinospirillum alkaliphilum DSM 21637 TaxID=1122209 RepID=A0A1K1ZG53_9GAMM|nr:alanyl-tRNA synthetase [Marinospirillum alkaliphilum DSM 21637]